MTRRRNNDAETEQAAQPAADPRIAEEVRRFTEAQQQRIAEDDERNPVLPSLRTDPTQAAMIVLERYFTKGGEWTLGYYRETWYSYFENFWSERTLDDIHQFIHQRLLNCRQVDSEGELIPFVVSRANVSEIMSQLQDLVGIPSHYRVPCERRYGKLVEVDARGKLVCRGMLVDMETGRTYSNHSMFIPNGAKWEHDAAATDCTEWMTFLHQLFGDKDDEIAMLQEWFGYVLSGSTRIQKGLILVGPPRAGKGVIGHVLSNLLGESMVASPALHAIGTRFGLENLIDKRLCLVSDARLSSRQDIFAVIETLLRIIGCDPVSVDRKNKAVRDLQLGVRVMLLSNELPQLSDNSPAINERFMILQLHKSFLGREDVHLLDKLLEELPAIANWAIKGYQRLIDKQANNFKFTEPQSSRDARDEWREGNNSLWQFLDDCCVRDDPDASVANDKLYEVYKGWCEWSGERFPLPKNSLKRKLFAMLSSEIKEDRSDKKARATKGLGVKPDNELPW